MQFELFRAKAVSSEAFESYEVNALDFLLKPIRYNKFLAAVEKARKLYQQPSAPQPQQLNTLFIRVDSEWRNVPIDQITYVNGMKDYVMFYLDNEPKPLITHLTMKAVEDMLPKDLPPVPRHTCNRKKIAMAVLGPAKNYQLKAFSTESICDMAKSGQICT